MNTVLAIPSHDGRILIEALPALMEARISKHFWKIGTVICSALPFNMLWAQALNFRRDGMTHFMMIHTDVVPTQIDWFDRMHYLASKHDADILSVAIPLKNHLGWTSTGFDTSDPWAVNRISMRDLCSDKYPGTFTAKNLVVNTGMMLVDFRKPWVEKICFDFVSRMTRRKEDGMYTPDFKPEDWQFSRDARKWGAKIFATKEITCHHVGSQNYVNYAPWGEEGAPQGRIENFDA